MTTTLLTTDGYKLSMAEAGWPLRRETFYYCHRRGGPQLLPFDGEAFVRSLLPTEQTGDYEYLTSTGYEMGGGFKAAMKQDRELSVRSLAKGQWFLPREPILTVTGPSALVSWIEPLLLQASFRIQVATLAKLDTGALAEAVALLACERQKEIVMETLDAVGVPAPLMRVDEEAYAVRVAARARELREITGSADRLFEVGLRSASCFEHHMLALRAVKEAGITRTSHVEGARRLGMAPVGTMGHEHVQRYGSDLEAFRAMRDRRPQRSSYLLDTFDTIRSGIPAALALIAEAPDRKDSVRYDSGDQEAQLRIVCEASKALGARPVHILEDGYDADRTRKMEALRKELGIGPDDVFYGYGGYLVSGPDAPLRRDRVAAVYKLTQTDHTPVMKLTESGKRSVPGRPVVFRRVRGQGPYGIIGQEGERAPEGYVVLTASSDIVDLSSVSEPEVGRSVATLALEAEFERRVR